MGRTRSGGKKQNISARSSTQQSHSSEPSIPSLLSKAQALAGECDFDLARSFTERILQRDKDNIEAKELLGVIQLETGDFDGAKQTFSSLIPPGPAAAPPLVYLYLAQLSEDDPYEALSHYQKAVDILSIQQKEKVVSGNAVLDETDIKANIVRALIGMVEIWMDPSYSLCDDPVAEQTCENLLTTALETDPGNAEALQMLASVRMSQSRPDDARGLLEQSWTAWKDLEPDDPKSPPLATRVQFTKLLLELAQYELALQVLQGIMTIDDTSVDAWYLEGWCFFLLAMTTRKTSSNDCNGLTWEELAKDARECLETSQNLHIAQNHPDEPLLEHIRELIENLDSSGIHHTESDDDIEADIDHDGDDWVDEDSEDEDIDMQ